MRDLGIDYRSVMHFVLRTLLAGFLMVASAALNSDGAVAETKVKPTLVELFTSQGCSSCPPADRFVGELAQRGDVVALAFHVNYWDYIGWQDPFATEETTNRQRAYGWRMAQGRVYTPQIVVDGVLDAVGSRRHEVNRTISFAQDLTRAQVEIDAAINSGGGLTVSLKGEKPANAAVVWMARYDAEHTTDILRGENRGATLKNFNVVRNWRKIGDWSGDTVEFHVTAKQMTSGEGGDDGYVIIVQAEGDGIVLGVRELKRGVNF